MKPEYIEDSGTGCWIWQRGRTSAGYGWASPAGLAHRVIYERHRGPIPPGLQIDHLCRHSLCVNPDHLEVVTSAQNTRRGLRTKLDRKQVSEILTLARGWVGSVNSFCHTTGPRFGVSHKTIEAIVYGRSWRDVYEEVMA